MRPPDGRGCCALQRVGLRARHACRAKYPSHTGHTHWEHAADAEWLQRVCIHAVFEVHCGADQCGHAPRLVGFVRGLVRVAAAVSAKEVGVGRQRKPSPQVCKLLPPLTRQLRDVAALRSGKPAPPPPKTPALRRQRVPGPSDRREQRHRDSSQRASVWPSDAGSEGSPSSKASRRGRCQGASAQARTTVPLPARAQGAPASAAQLRHTAIVTAAMMIPLQSKRTPVSDVKLSMLESGRRGAPRAGSDIPGQGGARSLLHRKSRGHSPTFQGGAASARCRGPGHRPGRRNIAC